MARVGTGTVFLVAALIIAVIFLACLSSFAQETPAVRTIPVEEVKAAEDKGTARITSREVEEARVVTAERIYGLLSLWALIILAIFLIRLQVRDDEKLYNEGYYSKDLE